MKDGFDWRTVYDFWFPAELGTGGFEVHKRMGPWWFRGGATPELPTFAAYVETAAAGRIDHWSATPRGRLALILVLDQFPRGLFVGTPQAYAYDPLALQLAEEGIEIGHFDALEHPWEKLFFTLPLGHAEGPGHVERSRRLVEITEKFASEAPSELSPIYEFVVSQARGGFEVISTFGRHPHRNAVLGRDSTPEEVAHIEKGDFVHLREPPYRR